MLLPRPRHRHRRRRPGRGVAVRPAGPRRKANPAGQLHGRHDTDTDTAPHRTDKGTFIFHRLIARQARRTFTAVNARDYDKVLASALPDMQHRFGGDHALGGQRHDPAHVRLWFERLHRVVPNIVITVNDVWVTGGLRRAVVFVRWTVSATLLDGKPYSNRGVHIIHLRNRKIFSIDVHEDSQAVAHALERQAVAGLQEASAPPILS